MSSLPASPEEKTPRPWRTRESSQSRRAALHQRNAPLESKFSFNPFFCSRLQSHGSHFFVFSPDLLPEEIFGTEEVPEYILSDSSTEKKMPHRNRRPTTNCAIAFDI
jgi:hypothetical protein